MQGPWELTADGSGGGWEERWGFCEKAALLASRRAVERKTRREGECGWVCGRVGVRNHVCPAYGPAAPPTVRPRAMPKEDKWCCQ